MPGMRMLATLECSQCKCQFYGDLPSGFGLYYPMLVDAETGEVYDRYDVGWFATWLRNSYANRTSAPLELEIEELKLVKQPIVLNCLDTLYGHTLLKLLNAQYYLDHCPEYDLIVLIHPFLRWMVPEGVAAIWTVNLPLKRGKEWNDWLADQLKQYLSKFESAQLSVAFSHPNSKDYDIERFTRIAPFPLHEWEKRSPTVTFIWREDRVWVLPAVKTKEISVLGLRWLHKNVTVFRRLMLAWQIRRVISVAKILRKIWPDLDFAVAGLGNTGRFPSWIQDLRTTTIDLSTEKLWCQRYADSHVFIGVHGSNMLLPSAQAGAMVNLVPDRWGNLAQDTLLSARDGQDIMFRYRFIPVYATAKVVAEVVATILRSFPLAKLGFQQPWNDHIAVTRDPWLPLRDQDPVDSP